METKQPSIKLRKTNGGAGGRPKGSPNKTTAQMKAAIACMVSVDGKKLAATLAKIDDPARRLEVYLKALEYCLPKLARTEVAGDPNAPILHKVYKWKD